MVAGAKVSMPASAVVVMVRVPASAVVRVGATVSMSVSAVVSAVAAGVETCASWWIRPTVNFGRQEEKNKDGIAINKGFVLKLHLAAKQQARPVCQQRTFWPHRGP